MPILTLKFKDNTFKKYRLKKGVSVTIGRRDSNKIVIDNLAVSGNHAKIDSVGDGFLFTDLQSKNGSFVNDELVTSHYLQDKDVISIGKHTLVFEYSDDEEKPERSDSGMDQTMVMDTEKHRTMLAGEDIKPTPGMEEPSESAFLTFLTGGEGDLPLTKKMTKIGKSDESDIIATGFLIGKNAATISIRPDGHYLSYVEGLSKPKVNDESVKGTIKLNEYDIIQIGSVKMQFTYKKK